MLKGIRKKALILLISSQPTTPASEASNHERVLQQVHDFETALRAMDLLLDDQGEAGVKLLKFEQAKTSKDPTAIFPLALGVMEFIEATLGFEAEVMEKAHRTLSQAEEASLAHSKLNQKLNLATSHIYPPGTEFQVTYAELTLLNALVMLLQENNSMMEQAKALLKLRKAYQILDATYKKIKDLEPLFNRNLAKFRKQAENASISSVDLPGYSLPDEKSSTSLGEDVRLMKNLEKIYQMRRRRINGVNLGPHASRVNLFKNESTLSVTLSRKSSSSMLHRSSFSSVRAPSPSPQFLAVNGAFKNDQAAKDTDDDDEFSDACETFTSSNAGPTLEIPALQAPMPEVPGFREGTPKLQVYPESIVSVDTSTSSLESAADSHLHVSTIDEFIHSGVQLCFGILQVVLSLIPPTIGRVLSIVGFKGDREVGLRMLWRTAITARNIHGELALLCLLVFYDGPIQFIDTGFQLPGHEDENIRDILDISSRASVSDAELAKIVKNPNLYTPQLLAKARMLFPHNALWALQEGRMLAAKGNIIAALDIMQNFTSDPEVTIQMEQVEALLTFDRALMYAFVHDYDSAARDLIRMLEINSWSQAVYLFLAGACYLEKWRMIVCGELSYPTEAEKEKDLDNYAEKAEHYLKLAPTYVPGHGTNASKKKGGIGGSSKQMPFDKYVLRKTKQIEDRQKKHRSMLYIQCVGTSLIHELIYFWNGYNRMRQDDLQLLHRMLGFSSSEHALFSETPDEGMSRCFFQSLALRNVGKVEEGLSLLDSKVIASYVVQDTVQAPFKFTKMTYSPYLYPTALYERAIFVWEINCKEDARMAVTESMGWLKKAETVSDVGDYELSNRTSMRIKAAHERLEQVKLLIQ